MKLLVNWKIKPNVIAQSERDNFFIKIPTDRVARILSLGVLESYIVMTIIVRSAENCTESGTEPVTVPATRTGTESVTKTVQDLLQVVERNINSLGYIEISLSKQVSNKVNSKKEYSVAHPSGSPSEILSSLEDTSGTTSIAGNDAKRKKRVKKEPVEKAEKKPNEPQELLEHFKHFMNLYQKTEMNPFMTANFGMAKTMIKELGLENSKLIVKWAIYEPEVYDYINRAGLSFKSIFTVRHQLLPEVQLKQRNMDYMIKKVQEEESGKGSVSKG